ncbi:MAG: hypothetical protein ACLGHT_05465 [Acidimicrobiia bacterium]
MVAALLLAIRSRGDDGAPTEFALPFGLEHVEGTEAVGRPALYDHEPYTFDGSPVQIRSLIAVYRVPAENPGAVFLDWIEQLDELAVTEVVVKAGSTPSEPWLMAESVNPFRPDGPPPDVAYLRLWATKGDPILSVEIDRAAAAPDPGRIRITGDRGRLPAPPAASDDDDRKAGDLLFEERGTKVRLPEGAATDVPTFTRAAGTGGTFSVFFAEDAEDAVEALLRDVRATSDDEEVTGPEKSTVAGVKAVSASFNLPAGGWGFDVVAVQGPDDEEATVYVTSFAD